MYPSTSRSVGSFSAIGWHSSIGSEQTRSATGFSWVSGVRCYSCHCHRRLEHWNGKEGRRDKRAVPRARLLSFRCTRKRSGSVLYRPSFFALGQAASRFLSVVDECLHQGREKRRAESSLRATAALTCWFPTSHFSSVLRRSQRRGISLQIPACPSISHINTLNVANRSVPFTFRLCRNLRNPFA